MSVGSETAAVSFKARIQTIFFLYTTFFLIYAFYGKLGHEKKFLYLHKEWDVYLFKMFSANSLKN